MPTTSLAPITRVGIVAKPQLHAATAHLVAIGDWLAARGIDAVFETATAALMPAAANRQVAAKATIARTVEMVLILGGDGTLLGMADCIGDAASGIPILGINFGSLGFLTEVTLPELYPSLEAAVAGGAPLEERLMLLSTTERDGEIHARQIALNDAVITRAAGSRMVDLAVWVGTQFMTRVKADGLIIGTPTGSTAYSLAAGGPIVQPSVDALIVTPIAPHTLTNRPVVISADVAVRVQPTLADDDEVFVSFDGQAGFRLQAGDEVVVRRAPVPLRLIKPSTRGYFEILRTKFKWGER
jgi:NAD+ kinase